jgi:hypothetical protein
MDIQHDSGSNQLERPGGQSGIPDSVAKWIKDRIPAYLADRQRDLANAAGALKIGNFSAIASVGHNMKGSGTSYGFPRITDIGGGLELAALSNNGAVVADCLRELGAYLSGFDGAVAQAESDTNSIDFQALDEATELL